MKKNNKYFKDINFKNMITESDDYVAPPIIPPLTDFESQLCSIPYDYQYFINRSDPNSSQFNDYVRSYQEYCEDIKNNLKLNTWSDLMRAKAFGVMIDGSEMREFFEKNKDIVQMYKSIIRVPWDANYHMNGKPINDMKFMVATITGSDYVICPIYVDDKELEPKKCNQTDDITKVKEQLNNCMAMMNEVVDTIILDRESFYADMIAEAKEEVKRCNQYLKTGFTVYGSVYNNTTYRRDIDAIKDKYLKKAGLDEMLDMIDTEAFNSN